MTDQKTSVLEPDDPALQCSIDESLIRSGGPPKDGIPALTDPKLVPAGHSELSYLALTDRVMGLEVDGQPVAIPLNIMWFHEIVNLTLDTAEIAVTHCPLTGSSLAFNRGVIDGGELGVSGLLYLNNLVMYDRTSSESLWPQMLRGAKCGPRDGTRLPMYPIIEMTYEGWLEAHPDTRVVSSQTGHDRQYSWNPYGGYGQPDSRQLLFPMPNGLDDRRPPKERGVGIPAGSGGLVFPFGELDARGPVAAVYATVADEDVLILWDRSRQAAMAFDPYIDGEKVWLSARDGRIVDVATGSEWRVDGLAVEGPSAGTQLEPIEEAFVAYWFAWAGLYPEVELWSA